MRHPYTRSPDIPGPARSLHRSSLQDVFTRPLWKSQYKSSLQDLFTRPLWEISIQELTTRSLDPQMRDLFTRALYKISSQDPIWDISIQELSTRSLHRTPIWDISIQDLLISLDLLGLLTGALYKISSQDLHERSLYKSSLRSPGIPGPPRSLHRSSLQDLFTSPIWEISLQELSKISWYPWTS